MKYPSIFSALFAISIVAQETEIDLSTLAPQIIEIGVFQTLSNIPKPEIACLGLNLAHYLQGGLPNYSLATGAAKNLLLGYAYGVGENVGSSIDTKIKKLEEFVTQINKPLISALITTLCGSIIYLLQTNSIEENIAEDALQTTLSALATYNLKIITTTVIQQIINFKTIILNKKHIIICSAGATSVAATCYYALPTMWLPMMYTIGNSILKKATLEFITNKATNAYCWLQAYNYAKNKEVISTKNESAKKIEHKEQ